MQVFSGAHEMSDSGSTRFSFRYYVDANYSTLHNLWARLALQDMYIDWGSVSAPLACPAPWYDFCV